MEKRIAVLHHNDADGFGAAYAAWRALPEELTLFVEVNHNQPFPVLPESVEIIYILDFSYSLEILNGLLEKYDKVMVIDHHKTAESQLKDFPEENKRFDMNKSGCILAWEYFFGDRKPPVILRYVEDRDLWRFDLIGSEAVNAYIYTMPNDFTAWEWFNWDIAFSSGKAILSYRDTIIQGAVESAVMVEFLGYEVPMVNATCLMSEIGNELCKKFDTPFSVTYCDRLKDKIRTYSLRSNDRVDVGVLAKTQGGGGHKNAAGFTKELGGL